MYLLRIYITVYVYVYVRSQHRSWKQPASVCRDSRLSYQRYWSCVERQIASIASSPLPRQPRPRHPRHLQSPKKYRPAVTIHSPISSVLRPRRLPPTTLRLVPKRTGPPYRPATARRSSSRCSQDRPLELIKEDVSWKNHRILEWRFAIEIKEPRGARI